MAPRHANLGADDGDHERAGYLRGCRRHPPPVATSPVLALVVDLDAFHHRWDLQRSNGPGDSQELSRPLPLEVDRLCVVSPIYHDQLQRVMLDRKSVV